MIGTLTPVDLKDRLERREGLVLLDVREPEEVAICSIGGSLSLPMGEILRRAGELDPTQPTVCICHHGIRSAKVGVALERLGFETVFNLSGGIDRRAGEVEPGMARY